MEGRLLEPDSGTAVATIPLVRRFPRLAAVPRALLATRLPTPVEHAPELAPGLWIKRDDLVADPYGGNKIRALEFLLGGIEPGERVITLGSCGSTHVLATAASARRLGATVSVFRWRQEMNEAAGHVARRIESLAGAAPCSHNPVFAYARAGAARLRGGRWIPAGGGSPLGVLGAVNGALELAEQIAAGALPAPRRIVVPLGSGGTAAGLALGARIAGLSAEIVAVRVVPRIVANRRRVIRLARATAQLIARAAGTPVPAAGALSVRVLHDYFGGAYGRPTPGGAEAAARCARCTAVVVDPTYSAKALAAAMALEEDGPTLFWLTFDARMAA